MKFTPGCACCSVTVDCPCDGFSMIASPAWAAFRNPTHCPTSTFGDMGQVVVNSNTLAHYLSYRGDTYFPSGGGTPACAWWAFVSYSCGFGTTCYDAREFRMLSSTSCQFDYRIYSGTTLAGFRRYTYSGTINLLTGVTLTYSSGSATPTDFGATVFVQHA